MRRLMQAGVIPAFLILVGLGAFGTSDAQDKIPQAKKAEPPSFTSEQKSVIRALSLQSPFTYITDGQGKFQRVSYAYTEVNFVGSCTLHYVEHEYVAKEGAGANDNVHRYTPTNVVLADLLAGEATVSRSSEVAPAPSGFRYSADAFVVDFPGRPGKAPHRLTFEGEQGAKHFLDLLHKAAKSCSAAP